MERSEQVLCAGAWCWRKSVAELILYAFCQLNKRDYSDLVGIDVSFCITKTCLYNFDPLKPNFYIVKLGFIGVYISFLISARSMDCGCSLEPPRRDGSNECPRSVFCAEL